MQNIRGNILTARSIRVLNCLAGSRGSHITQDSVELDWMKHRKIQLINETGKWAGSLSRPSVFLTSSRNQKLYNFTYCLRMPKLIFGTDYTKQFILGSFQ